MVDGEVLSLTAVLTPMTIALEHVSAGNDQILVGHPRITAQPYHRGIVVTGRDGADTSALVGMQKFCLFQEKKHKRLLNRAYRDRLVILIEN
jgi:hypothetical protein